MKRFVSAQEAATELGVSLATLYSYVSRGLVRSEHIEGTEGGKKRQRRYRRDDVQRLMQRKNLHKNPESATERALSLGSPIMESAITLITENHCYYRGYDVAQLAMNYSFEQVAMLIWMGTLPEETPLFFAEARQDLSSHPHIIHQSVMKGEYLEAFQVFLSLADTKDVAAYDVRSSSLARIGASLLYHFVSIATGCEVGCLPIAQVLQQGWASQDPQAALLLNTALVLVTDHELNSATLAARCVASSGGTLYAAVGAGLLAFQGTKYAGSYRRVEEFLREAATKSGVSSALIDRLRRGDVPEGFGRVWPSAGERMMGEVFPGFGTVFYPNGDPRARVLLERIGTAYPHSQVIALAKAVEEEVYAMVHERPTLDFAFVVLSHVLHLPAGAAIALFALSRTAGWIGHAIEQYQTQQLIRPRARYIGQQPFEENS